MHPNTPPPPQYPNYTASAPPLAPPPGKWTTGICGGREHPLNWVITCFFPCVTFAYNAAEIDQNRESCLTAGLMYYALAHCCCACLYTHTYRTRLREQYDLPAKPCGDLCLHCCCNHCALNQEFRELKNRGRDPLVTGNDWAASQVGRVKPPTAATMTR